MEKIQVMVDKTAAVKLLDRLPLAMQYGLLAGLAAGLAAKGANVEPEADLQNEEIGETV